MSAIASISEVKSGEVHGPSFAVYAAVGGDQNMVTRTKAALTFALDAKSCRTAEEQHPFVMHVTMWLIRRRRVAETIRVTFSCTSTSTKISSAATQAVIEKIDNELGLQSGA